MKRVRLAPIQKCEEEEQEVICRSPVPASPGIFVDQHGNFWKQYPEYDNDWLRCWPNGNVRDQETKKWKVGYGRAFRKPCLSRRQMRELNDRIRARMEQCFPGCVELDGKIPRVYRED